MLDFNNFLYLSGFLKDFLEFYDFSYLSANSFPYKFKFKVLEPLETSSISTNNFISKVTSNKEAMETSSIYLDCYGEKAGINKGIWPLEHRNYRLHEPSAVSKSFQPWHHYYFENNEYKQLDNIPNITNKKNRYFIEKDIYEGLSSVKSDFFASELSVGESLNKILSLKTNLNFYNYLFVSCSVVWIDLNWVEWMRIMDYDILPKDLLIKNPSDYNLLYRNNTFTWTNYDQLNFSLHNGNWVFVREVLEGGKEVHHVYWKAKTPLIEYLDYYEIKVVVDPLLTEYFTSVREWSETISKIADADYSGYLRKKKEILKALDYNRLEEYKIKGWTHYRPRLSWRYLNPKNEAYFDKIFKRYRP